MSDFAKIFNTEYGQVLVKIDSSENDEHEAEVRIYFQPEGLGVCNTAFHFSDWEKAEKAFDLADENLCLDVMKQVTGAFSK